MPETITLTDGTTKISYSTKETAAAIRAALKQQFPGVKFSVRTSYASMTSSTDIRWTDGPTTAEVELVTDNFTSKSFDGSTDSTNYHSQTVNGQRVQYSGWVSTHREISLALYKRAIARYNADRAEYGASASDIDVEISRWGGPMLVGSDLNKLNPCGGRAMYGSDAVNQIAYKMRDNGIIVNVKGRY